MIQNVTKSCRELAKYVRIKETLLNAAGVARGPRAGGTRGEGVDNFGFCRIGNKICGINASISILIEEIKQKRFMKIAYIRSYPPNLK